MSSEEGSIKEMGKNCFPSTSVISQQIPFSMILMYFQYRNNAGSAKGP